MNILDKIVFHKKEEVSQKKQKVKEAQLTGSPLFSRPCQSLSEYISHPALSGIIAEFKRKSPSKSDIHLQANVAQITADYAQAGSSALSVLTDHAFFGGSDEDLMATRTVTDIPVLRKEFIIDPYQIIEAKSIGADAILLIAEILSAEEVKSFARLAVDCGMEVLLEIHSSEQLHKYHDSIRNIGVNNRNLKNFHTDIACSLQLLPQLPSDTIKISESGLDNPQTVAGLKKAGYNGFLIGENFMKHQNPGEACAGFIRELKQWI